MHRTYLLNAQATHAGLIIKNAAKIVFIGKNFILHGQESTTRIDQINAGQMIALGYFLGPQMFFHSYGKVGAAFDRRIIGDNHAGSAMHHADASDYSSRRDFGLIKFMASKV